MDGKLREVEGTGYTNRKGKGEWKGRERRRRKEGNGGERGEGKGDEGSGPPHLSECGCTLQDVVCCEDSVYCGDIVLREDRVL